MKDTILTISGKPGLYKIISRGKNTLIVEILDDTHKRMPVFPTDSISNLNDISMYTSQDDVSLNQVLDNLLKLEDGKKVSINYKKCSSKELREHFKKVLPSYDEDRIHDSHIKKLFSWYDILLSSGIKNFLEEQQNSQLQNYNEKKG